MKRDSRLDLLRVLSMTMVIVIHIANYYCRAYSDIAKISYLGALIFNAISRISVPIFFMISGATLLHKPYDKNKNRIRIKRKVAVLFIVTIVYFLWDKYFMSKDIDVFKILGMPERKLLWFIYAIIGIYISLPFVKCMVDNMSREQDKFFVILWIIFNGLLKHIGITKYYRIPIVDGTYYLGYFIIGYLIIKHSKEIEEKAKNTVLIIMSFVSFAMIIVITYFVSVNKGKHFTGLLSYSNIFIILASLSVFILIYFNADDKENKYIAKLSQLSFGVYLTHGIILDLLMKIFPYKNINSFIGIPLLLFFILFFSSLTVELVKRNKLIDQYL